MKRILGLILITLSFFIEAIANCAFCREQVIESQLVYETENFYVLADYEPRVEGHLLAVTKRHVVKAHEMTLSEWTELYEIIDKTVRVFIEALGIDNYVILEKNGREAFQEIGHVHFHLLPVRGKKWDEIFPSHITPKRLSPEELRETVEHYGAYFSTSGMEAASR